MSERHAAISAALVLAVGMGFGRFAFTGLYPLMVADGQITVASGSYAASANYAGYLIGALLAGAVLMRLSSYRMCVLASIGTVISLAFLALPLTEFLFAIMRGIAGIASAFALVGASQWLIHDRHRNEDAAILFAGVGVGIVVSSELIAYGQHIMLTSREVWLLLALAALAMSIVAIMMQRRAENSEPVAITASPAPIGETSPPFGPTRLIVIYGLAGFGYIITATYLPLLMSAAVAGIDPVHIWAVFGASIIPGCFFWHALHERLGTKASLIGNLVVQMIGVALPVLHHPAAYIASALLVGGSSIGTVTIAMPAARKLASKVRFNMMAIMTASYGVGQIVGPLLANALHMRTGSFDASLITAAAALALGVTLALFPSRPEH